MRIVASLDAARFIRERGGRLFVWLRTRGSGSGSRTVETSTEPPSDPRSEFERHDADGFELFLDRNLAEPDELRVRLRRWPRQHVVVGGFGGVWLGEGGDGGGGDGGWGGDGGGGDGGGGGGGG